MTIGIDARTISKPHITGVGKYVLRLVEGLLKDHTVILFTDVLALSPLPPSATVRWVVQPARHRWLWEIIVLPKLLKKNPVDVYHATWNYGVPKHPATIVTIHDIIPLVLPDLYQKTLRDRFETWCVSFFIRQSIKRAQSVIADSHSTAKDVARFFPHSRNKLQVIHLGIDSPSKELSEGMNLRKLHLIQLPYFVYFGGFEKRKNLPLLLRTFSEFTNTHPETQLVLIGEKNLFFQRQLKPLITENVRVTGYLADVELQTIARSATALIYPSLYEGFGFPVLESMALGVPVISSNTSSLPEVIQKAGILVNPNSSQALISAMEQLHNDKSKCASLIEAGQRQVNKFSWEHMVQQTIVAYQHLNIV